MDNLEFFKKLLGKDDASMSPQALTFKNAKFIQELNANVVVLSQNIKTLTNGLHEVARDNAALSNALIAFLKEKGLIATEEDLRLLQKLHNQEIARIDQKDAERRPD